MPVSEAWIDRQRERKALDLEDIATELGVRADDLTGEDARERILVAYAKRKGKRRGQVHASIKTWRMLWRFMHDRETRGQGNGANPFIGQQRTGAVE
jgi:hypothetical protein